MRLMSPRRMALNHTLELLPSETSPRTTAPLAMKTPLPMAGFLPRNRSSCFSSLVILSFVQCAGSVMLSMYYDEADQAEAIPSPPHSPAFAAFFQGSHTRKTLQSADVFP